MTIKLSELVRIIIVEYIDNPELLIVEEEDGESTVLIRVNSSDKTDTGKIIGKMGKNIDALRRIINVVASKREVRVNLHIVS